RVYKRYCVPGAGRAIIQGAIANYVPHSPFKVDFANDTRAPLRILGGELDRLLPVAIQKDTAKRWARSRALTELRLYPGRSHFTLGQDGWESVADEGLDWALEHAMQRAPVPGVARPEWAGVPVVQPT